MSFDLFGYVQRFCPLPLRPVTHLMISALLLNPRHRHYAWSFQEPVPEEIEDFVAAFAVYNAETDPDVSVRDFQLIDAAAVQVRFSGLQESGAEEYVDMEVLIQSSDGGPLRFFEFMFRLHSQVAPFLVGAHHEFYEGLSVAGVSEGTPILTLIQGS